MKWYFYIFLFVAFACNKSAVTVSEDEIGADVFYVRDSYKPYTGKCLVLFNNSDIVKEQFTFRKGLLNGETLVWYKNGQIHRKGSYSRGQISGKWIFWDEEGNKYIEASYRHDSLHGSYTMLFDNGKMMVKGQFSGNRRSGKWLYYNEEGKVIRSDSW